MQFGVSALLGPVIVAVMPVPTGAVNPHGLVKTSAVTFNSAGIVLSLMFNIRPTILTSAGSVTVLSVNREGDEDVPNPTHPPSPTNWLVAKYIAVLPGSITGQGQGGQSGGQGWKHLLLSL